jgi:small ligand-binding sensory domain FIST
MAGAVIRDDLRFRSAMAAGAEWGHTVKACLDRLGNVKDCNLGILYVTDGFAGDATSIVTLLRGVTGIRHWVGTVGLGVCAGAEEVFDQPAIAVMTARLPEDAFRLFPVVAGDLAPLRQAAGAWLDRNHAMLGLVHADPHTPRLAGVLDDLAEATGAFLVGALSASRGEMPQFTVPASTDGLSSGPVDDGGVSGVLFAPGVAVATGLTQGCSPIGPARTVTASEDNVILELDGRPALEWFKEDIGELLARDLRKVAGYIFAAMPIAGSDTGDYLVRNLVAIDPRQGWIAIGDRVETGQSIIFTRRDKPAAEADLLRMLRGLKRRLSGPPKGAVYVSCVARGPNLFGKDNQELALIRQELGEVPLVGLFAGGEISHNRLYGYTGVLTLFM